MEIIMKVRLQKWLAHRGIASRRTIEQWIVAGRVSINKKLAKLGDGVNPGDEIEINGRRLRVPNEEYTVPPRTVVLNKPLGLICSRHDEQGRPTIYELIPDPKGKRWISVGRLDLNTTGVLLLTTDGDLAHRLMHPSQNIEREYLVRVQGVVSETALSRMAEGVELDDGPAHFDLVELYGGGGTNRWYRVVLREGRKREVRRLWESQGFIVNRLIRVRFGTIQLGKKLRAGEYMELEPAQRDSLYQLAGLTPPVDTPEPKSDQTRRERRGRTLKIPKERPSRFKQV